MRQLTDLARDLVQILPPELRAYLADDKTALHAQCAGPSGDGTAQLFAPAGHGERTDAARRLDDPLWPPYTDAQLDFPARARARRSHVIFGSTRRRGKSTLFCAWLAPCFTGSPCARAMTFCTLRTNADPAPSCHASGVL